MGVMEILREYVHELDPKVKSVLIDVIMAEQAMIDSTSRGSRSESRMRSTRRSETRSGLVDSH